MDFKIVRRLGRRVLCGLLCFFLIAGCLPAEAMASSVDGVLNQTQDDDAVDDAVLFDGWWHDGMLTTPLMTASDSDDAVVPVGSKAIFELTDGNGSIPMEVVDGVSTYDVKNAANRASLRYCYAYISITVITGGEDEIPAHTVRIELPASLTTVRNGKSVQHNFDKSKSDVGTAWSVNTKGDPVVIENTAPVGVNSHGSLMVAYKLDCWNVPSGEPFVIPCRTSFNGLESTETDLVGSVLTGVHVASCAWWPFECFDNANFSSDYIDRWSVIFANVGLSKEMFLADVGDDAAHPDYVYDIMEVDIGASLQQPYDIKGTFYSGSWYRPSGGSEYRPNSGSQSGLPTATEPYGWDGELVAAFLTPSSKTLGRLIQLNVGNLELKDYVDLPWADTDPSHASRAGVQSAMEHKWNTYEFGLSYDELAANNLSVLSGFTDGSYDSDEYRLLFLVRYPNKDVTSRDGTCSIITKSDDGHGGYQRRLSASMELSHIGIDDRSESTYSTSQLLYMGQTDDVDYEGDIYWVTYVDAASDLSDSKGLTNMLRGRDEKYSLTADWYCFNGNRNGMRDSDRYTLEAIVDVGFMSTGSAVNGDSFMLDPEEYYISSYGFEIADAEDVGGAKYNKNNGYILHSSITSKPDWAKDEHVVVYGSSSLTGDDWVELQKVSLYDVWARSNYWSTSGYTAKINMQSVPEDFGNIVRLKVVYPNSRYTAVIRIRYEVSLRHDAGRVGEFVDSLLDVTDAVSKITHWCNYTAYEATSYADKYESRDIFPDLKTKYDDVAKKSTGSEVREFDRTYPYPGYSTDADVDVFPMRNVVQVDLGMQADAVGMIVTQYLYNDTGSIMGDPSLYSASIPRAGYVGYTASKMTDVKPGISKIKYTLSGAVSTEASTYESFRTAIDDAKGLVSPLSCTTSRYYALLPEGFHYKKDSLGSAGNGWTGIYLTEGNVPGISPCTYYVNGQKQTRITYCVGISQKTVSVMEYDLGGRTLVVFDVPIKYPTSEYGLNYAWPGDYYFNYPSQLNQYFHSTPISFEIEPDDPDEVIVGTYETTFFHQFLNTDEDGGLTAVPLKGYRGTTYTSAEDIVGSGWGSGVDACIVPGADNSLMSIQTVFRSFSGSGMTYCDLKVKAGEKDDYSSDYSTKAHSKPGEAYTYALSYGVVENTSTDVVLWDSIESYCREKAGSVVKSDWHGRLKSFDLNGIDDVAVFVNEDAVNIREYLSSGADSTWLDAVHGWIDVNDVDDIGKYKSIAFWFGDKIFDASGKIGQKTATVYVTMAAPTEDDPELMVGEDDIFTHNEIIFSDKHGTTQSVGTVLGNHVVVDLPGVKVNTDGFEMPKTGGAGIGAYYAIGSTAVLAAALVLFRKRRSV